MEKWTEHHFWNISAGTSWEKKIFWSGAFNFYSFLSLSIFFRFNLKEKECEGFQNSSQENSRVQFRMSVNSNQKGKVLQLYILDDDEWRIVQPDFVCLFVFFRNIFYFPIRGTTRLIFYFFVKRRRHDLIWIWYQTSGAIRHQSKRRQEEDYDFASEFCPTVGYVRQC